MAVQTEEITIRLPREMAAAYQNAPPEQQRRMAFYIGLHIRNLMHPRPTLEEVMDAMSEEAEANGLTDEQLDELIRELDEERGAERGGEPSHGDGFGEMP